MKTMKLLPLKIAVTSALIVGLGAASTANAQQRSNPLPIEEFLPNLGELQLAGAINNDQYDQISAQYHNMIIGKTSIVSEVDANHIAQQTDSNTALKFYSDSENSLPSSMLFHQILTRQQLNGFKVGQPFIPVDNNGNPITQEDEVLDGRQKKKVRSVTTRIATQKDVEESPYANGIQKDIDDLYDFDHQVTERLTQHGKTIYRNGERILANEESVQYLNKEVQNNIEHIYELAQQQDQHSSDIKTLNKNVEEGLLELSGHLIDQKADLTKDIKALESNVEEGLLELSGHLIDQKADLTKDIKALESNVEEGLLDLSGRLLDQKADIAQNQTDIQDLAAYNELQDQYAQKQTEAIDALNKASSENTQNIEDLAAYNELQDAYAKQQTEAIDALNKASSENTQNIAKNQADIANNINNIYELAQQQDQHSSDIKTLAKASAANTNRIATAELGIAENKKDAQIAKAQANANKTAIDANKASADTKFAATADAITKNGNAITKNAKSITDLGTKVDGFDGRVTALDTKVNAFDGRITALDSKVENGMAAQAALSGLFQPYSVGKFNATAALGGYGSKSAVAIGAGYRVNPNLAFKAGAAINTSGNKKGSYNIGVNYEF
ncbi:uspA1 [Moraxella catarrhalis]|uniref:UspA1 n=3 Tax=Moraxella catarrhalis TaxID=480 RepID=A0ABY0BH41_MORCA|nr:YadA-like family protein [Moraxella catarrhalis]MPX41630.1 cell surface protein [Moraxella catarrhalis]RUO11848.1 uspA1 [Moraxella catarrhalis]RUO14976.1 uspA1 [Moraxella catarrhalis]